MTYRDLNIHQRINVKSWVRHDIPIPCVYHSVLLYDTGLPHQLADNIDTQCDRESRLFRRNWSQIRFPRQPLFMSKGQMQRIAEQIMPDRLVPSEEIAQDIRDKDIQLDVFKE